MVMKDDLTLGDGHTMQCVGHRSQTCTPETYMTLGPTLTPISLIFFKFYFN